MAEQIERCQAQVGQPPHWIHYHRCTRYGRHEHHGLALCAAHLKMVEGESPVRASKFYAFHGWGQYPTGGGGSFGDCRRKLPVAKITGLS